MVQQQIHILVLECQEKEKGKKDGLPKQVTYFKFAEAPKLRGNNSYEKVTYFSLLDAKKEKVEIVASCTNALTRK